MTSFLRKRDFLEIELSKKYVLLTYYYPKMSNKISKVTTNKSKKHSGISTHATICHLATIRNTEGAV